MGTLAEIIKSDIYIWDNLSNKKSFIHRIDSRINLFVTIAFVLSVMSVNRYSITALFPFFLYPVVAIIVGELPILNMIKKAIIMSPFVIMIGVFNPVFDKSICLNLYGTDVSCGWMSFFSIVIRFFLTFEAGLILIGITGINKLCHALKKMELPEIFVTQIFFLYRYLFVLIEEASNIVRAKNLRGFGKNRNSIKLFGQISGSLLLRTYNRAKNIYVAMKARGYEGDIKRFEDSKVGTFDILYGFVWIAFFVLVRFFNIPLFLGNSILKVF